MTLAQLVVFEVHSPFSPHQLASSTVITAANFLGRRQRPPFTIQPPYCVQSPFVGPGGAPAVLQQLPPVLPGPRGSRQRIRHDARRGRGGRHPPQSRQTQLIFKHQSMFLKRPNYLHFYCVIKKKYLMHHNRGKKLMIDFQSALFKSTN